MIRAACHCTAVRLEIDTAPTAVLDCNCTLCRRYGGLWAYYEPGEVNIVAGASATTEYRWGSNMLGFHFCKTCGCLMFHEVVGANPAHIRGINARMIPTLDPASVRVKQLDGSHTGYFWTKADEPVIASHHPKMAMPSAEDWR